MRAETRNTTTDADMQSVTEASDCSFRRYEGLRLRSLKQQVTSAKENWGGEMEDNDGDLGVSVYEKANALLENIEKAKSERWKVKSEEFENTLKPVVMQCHDILRHIAYFQLPPVYPWILELTDAGLELAYQVPNVGGVYLKRQESITATKCFESTEQERIRAKTKRKGSMLA